MKVEFFGTAVKSKQRKHSGVDEPRLPSLLAPHAEVYATAAESPNSSGSQRLGQPYVHDANSQPPTPTLGVAGSPSLSRRQSVPSEQAAMLSQSRTSSSQVRRLDRMVQLKATFRVLSGLWSPEQLFLCFVPTVHRVWPLALAVWPIASWVECLKHLYISLGWVWVLMSCLTCVCVCLCMTCRPGIVPQLAASTPKVCPTFEQVRNSISLKRPTILTAPPPPVCTPTRTLATPVGHIPEPTAEEKDCPQCSSTPSTSHTRRAPGNP